MKIVNLLPILAFGDAVGNDALAIHKGLRDLGYESVLAACSADDRITACEKVLSANDLSFITEEDLVIYHFSTGHKLNLEFGNLTCRKILRYHNVTPPHFFCGYHKDLLMNCMQGYQDLVRLNGKVECCIADSGYNKSELIRMGFRCPIDVVPVLIPFEDYKKKPDKMILQKYQNDGYVNFLFTGRISPNKRQEEVIAVFDAYQKIYNPKSRLFLVGKYDGMENYYGKLKRYVKVLGTQNVKFTGHIRFDEILGYYQVADLFLCMSDHEGFCVPIVEAMNFNIPIVAKAVTAVPETMGEGGIAIAKDTSFAEIAGVCNQILNDTEKCNVMREKQLERLNAFCYDRVLEEILQVVRSKVS